MAFNKENFFTEGNSEESFFSRTNPLANPANAEILKIQQCGDCDVELVVQIEPVVGGTSFKFGAPTNTYTPAFVKIQLTDGHGNFATYTEEGSISNVTIDTTSFIGDDWTVYLEIKLTNNVLAECGCGKIFTFKYSNAETVIDTTTVGAGVLALYAKDGIGTPVTEIDLGSFPAGVTPIPFEFYATNTGDIVLVLQGVNITSDVLSASIPTFGNNILPNNLILISGTVDADLAAGAQSGTVEVYTDSQTITLTINYTIV